MLSVAKHLAAHRERSFAALRMTSDPRLLPILVVKIHNRPLQFAHEVRNLAVYAEINKGRVANETEAGKVQVAVAWLNSHYHLVNKIVTPPVTIWLYETRNVGALACPCSV
jgi:hypothetical protein